MAEGKGGPLMYVRLQLAYALEFAIWGCWSYALGSFGAKYGVGVGILYSAFAFGALFSPVVGPIADKKFAAQKVFAFMQTVCGLALLACGVIAKKFVTETVPESSVNPGAAWIAMMFIAGLMFMPSIPLLNAIVFKHIPNSKKSPLVFIFGTLGWIAVNLVLTHVFKGGVEVFYFVDGIIAIALAVYALTLPNTPPSGSSNNDPFGFKALGLFKRFDFALFIICATLVGIFGSNYYFALVGQCFPDKGVWNQYSEIIFMAALAFAVAKIGLKWTLTLGLGAWGVRYLCFAQGSDSLAVVGILCHGLAYAFLYTAAYMYGDRVAPKEMKASVQALIAFLLLGVAQTLSGLACDYALRANEIKSDAQPAAEAPAEASYFIAAPAFAQDASIDAIADEDPINAAEPVVEEAVEEAAADVANVVDAAATEAPADVEAAAEAEAPAEAEAAAKKGFHVWDKANQAKYNWKKIWGLPGVFCLIFALIFAVLGKEPKAADEEAQA